MAVAAYTTDLTVIVDMDSTTGTAAEPDSVYTVGRSPINNDTDFTIEGTYHASLTFNATGKGGVVVPGSSRTWTSGDYLFGWITWLAPGSIYTKSGGGLSMICGSAVTALKVFYVGGSDFGSYPYGGWQNFAVDPEQTADETIGTSPTDFYVVGCGAYCSSKVNKGNPLGFDVFRYGRGEIRVAGGTTSSDADATFTGMATSNDASSAKWGLFQAIEGGYKWKGKMVIGYGAACDFTDSDVNIIVDNVDQVDSDFNRIELTNASSVINWTNISIQSLSTVSPGHLVMVDDCTLNDNGGIFTDMTTFVYDSNATITGRTFRRCGQVTQAGATLTGCIFDSPGENIIDSSGEEFSALLCDDIEGVTDCEFNSYGFGHAIELTSAHADSSGATAYDMDGNVFTGYASSDGSTGDEAIYNNSGGHVTINVLNGVVPSVRNGTSASTSIATSVPLYILVKDTDGDPISGAQFRVAELDGTEIKNDATDVNGEIDTSYSGSTPVNVKVWGRKCSAADNPKYENYSSTQVIASITGLVLTVTMVEDPNNNATT